MNILKRLFAVLALASIAPLISAASALAASVTISPLPGAPAAMPETQISFLGAPAGSLSSISVVGSRSGRHSGHLHAYSSAAGASFLPSRPFTPGRARDRPRAAAVRAQHAGDRHPLQGRGARGAALHRVPARRGHARRRAELPVRARASPPAVTVHQAAGAASAPGYLFAAPFLGPGQWGPMIFDSAGNLVWFRQVPAGQDAADFTTQVFHGKNDLTWWQGRTITLGYGLGEDVIADANYRTVAVVKAGNGLPTDEHEFTVLPNGAALVTAYGPVQDDLSSAGGPSSGTAVDGVAAGDRHPHGPGDVGVGQPRPRRRSKTPTRNRRRRRAATTTTSTSTPPRSCRRRQLPDLGAQHLGHLQARRAHRAGSSGSSAASAARSRSAPGVAFAYQHNALLLPNGELSLFDDEGAPTVNPPSRGEIVKLDTSAKKATLVQPVRAHDRPRDDEQPGRPAVAARRRLDGRLGRAAELHRIQLPGPGRLRRPAARTARTAIASTACRGPGSPPNRRRSPRVSAGGVSTVYASWNGATTVSSWQLLTGPSASQLTAVSTTPRSGFETTIPAPAAAFYEVRALSASGRVLGTSQAISPSP